MATDGPCDCIHSLYSKFLHMKFQWRQSQMPWDTFKVENADETSSPIELHFKLQLIDMSSCHIHHLFQVNSLFKCLCPTLLSTHLPEICQLPLSFSAKFSSSSTIFFSFSWYHLSLLSSLVMPLLPSCTFFSLPGAHFLCSPDTFFSFLIL